MSLGCVPVAGFQGILPPKQKKFKISMLKNAMTGHPTGSSDADLQNLLTSTFSDFFLHKTKKLFHIRDKAAALQPSKCKFLGQRQMV